MANVAFSGNNLLERMQELLIKKDKGWFQASLRLGEKLTEYLRDNRKGEYRNSVPNWDRFPIARNFYTQLDEPVRG